MFSCAWLISGFDLRFARIPLQFGLALDCLLTRSWCNWSAWSIIVLLFLLPSRLHLGRHQNEWCWWKRETVTHAFGSGTSSQDRLVGGIIHLFPVAQGTDIPCAIVISKVQTSGYEVRRSFQLEKYKDWTSLSSIFQVRAIRPQTVCVTNHFLLMSGNQTKA